MPKKSSKPPIQTISFVSLGCPKNLVASEKMLGRLAEDGLLPVSYDSADGFSGADAVVVNTCGFLEASKEESLDVIREAVKQKEAGNVKRVIVAGCLVQRHRARIQEWVPGIDAMIGVFDRDHIVDAVRGGTAPGGTALQSGERASLHNDAPRYWIAGNALQAAKARGLKTTGLTVNGKDGKGLGYFEDDSARMRLTPRHYAYLRISEGCNQNCAFCTIPSIRGKMRSKPLDRIAAEARELAADGAFELNLLGQDTTSYGDDIGLGVPVGQASRLPSFDGGLPLLLKTLSDSLAGQPTWLRLMYAYPSNFSDRVIDAFGAIVSEGRLLPYIDIPLQHASDRMLTAMRRNVTRAQQQHVITRLRERIPGIAIRTTFITGFPGETESDHGELLEFLDTMKFDAMGVFEYSQEEGTVAGTMEKDPALAVPAEVKTARRAELMALQQTIAFERNKSIAAEFSSPSLGEGAGGRADSSDLSKRGRRFEVLIDSELRTRGRKTTGVADAAHLYQGRTYAQAPQIDSVTYVHSARKLTPGELVPSVITDADGYDLIARPVAGMGKRIPLSISH